MNNKRIIFVSNNKHKIHETTKILHEFNITVVSSSIKLHEIQTENINQLVKDKTIKAFKQIKNKLIVEHTGLFIKDLNDLPGIHTQVFWDSLGKEKFTQIARKLDSRTLIAKTIIGYCDCKKIYIFHGEIEGVISEEPKGDDTFQWDCIFIPQGYSQTFAELDSVEKNKISMRKIALIDFAEHFLEKENEQFI